MILLIFLKNHLVPSLYILLLNAVFYSKNVRYFYNCSSNIQQEVHVRVLNVSSSGLVYIYLFISSNYMKSSHVPYNDNVLNVLYIGIVSTYFQGPISRGLS